MPDERSEAGAGQSPADAPAVHSDRLFDLLSDGTRRRILSLLLDHREICVCRLVGALALPQPKVSRHLATLREAGLLATQRKGTWILYRLDPQLPGWAVRVVAMMAEGARLEHDYQADRERLARLKPCGEDGLR